MIDNKGPFVCAAGTLPTNDTTCMGDPTQTQTPTEKCTVYYDICGCLVPNSLPVMPVDPQYGHYKDCTDYNTQYTIKSGSVIIGAPWAQLGETVSSTLPGQITVVILPGATDTIPPTVGTTSPTLATVNVATDFSASVSDNVAATSCSLFVDGVNQGPMTLSTSPCTNCTASKDYTFTSTGTFPMYAKCSDAAGNTANGASVDVIVTAPAVPDFSLSANPTTIKAPQTGTSQSVTIIITSINNFNSAVNLSVTSGLPAGATANFIPNPITPPPNGNATSNFTISTSNVTAGSYTLTIRGQSGAIAKTTDVTLEVVNLSVSLAANPSSGTAPLNGVDLTANVSGSATGTINYKFDCTSDGTWDFEVNNITSTAYTAVDLCNYPSAGNYTAKVRVERDIANVAEGVTQVTVIAPVPVFDAVSSANALTLGTFTWNHTIGGGNNRLLVVGFGFRADANVVSVKYNNVILTQIRTDSNGTTINNNKTSLWYMAENNLPPAGTYPIEVVISLASGIVGGATSWTGVNQATPIGNHNGAGGTASSPSVNVISSPEEIVADVVYVRNSVGVLSLPTLTVGPGQTQRWNLDDTGNGRGGGSTKSGSATVTMSWTFGNQKNPNWAMSVAAIKP
jgi:hypothetical protein